MAATALHHGNLRGRARNPRRAGGALFVNPLTVILVLPEVQRVIDVSRPPNGTGLVVVSGAASVLGRIKVLHALHRGHEVVAGTRRARSANTVAAELGIPAVATQTESWADASPSHWADATRSRWPMATTARTPGSCSAFSPSAAR